MENNRTFYRCDICGNLVEKIEDSGVLMVCCGQNMTLLRANSSDGASEKHLPVEKIDNNNLNIKISSVPHPMTEEHHINWVVIAYKNTTKRVNLKINQDPEINTLIDENDSNITIYSYCNIHGLWATEIKR